MAFTTEQLITEAYYLSGIVARDFQTVSGSQLNDGLYLLNAYLAVKTANQKLIPYYKMYDFTATTGQELYFIPNLVAIETFTYFIGNVRYSSEVATRRKYFGQPRVQNINSLPFEWRQERTLNGMNLYLYFLPQQNFPLEIYGKFGLQSVVFGEDLTTVYDMYYIEYLRHGLAEYICGENNITFQRGGSDRLKELEEMLTQISPPDLSVSRISTIGMANAGINWGDVNCGRGWRPS